MAWDDDKKAKAIQMYTDGEPTPDNSIELVKEISDELGESVNGVRMILTRANVYVKKEPAKAASKSSASGGSSGGSTRVSKEDAHKQLVAAIEDHGQTADTEIISKMTGKAALHFAGIFAAIPKAE